MSVDMVMPVLDESMEEGTVLEWLKQPGDHVAFGEGLVEIQGDKASMVYDSDTAGILLEIVVQAGQTVPTGTVIARIGSPEELT